MHMPQVHCVADRSKDLPKKEKKQNEIKRLPSKYDITLEGGFYKELYVNHKL